MTTAPRRRRPRRLIVTVVALGLAAVLVGGAALYDRRARGPATSSTGSMAKVDRFLAGPVPDRVGAGHGPRLGRSERRGDRPARRDRRRRDAGTERRPVRARPRRIPARARARAGSPTAEPDPDAGPRRRSTSTSSRTTTSVFAHEIKDTWCASAGVQMALADPRQGQHSQRLPARAPGPRPRVGELRRQPQRRLGTVGDGPGARCLRREGLRGPRLQDPPGGAARRRQGDREDRLARRSCWPGAAPTPGS